MSTQNAGNLKSFIEQVEMCFPKSTTWKSAPAPVGAPAALRKWIQANGKVSAFSYKIDEELWGGLEFGPLAELLNDCREWMNETWVAEDEEQLPLWESAVPFAKIETGDFIAFAKATDDDAPIIYLSHDDESKIIAPSFASFVEEWANIGFLGPESWMLENFLDEQTGYLRVEAANEDGAELLNRFRAAKVTLPN